MSTRLIHYEKVTRAKYSFSGDTEWVTTEWAVGLLFQPAALWVGAHYSKNNKRLCINILPMLTLWITFREGNTP